MRIRDMGCHTSPNHPLKQHLSGCNVVLRLWLIDRVQTLENRLPIAITDPNATAADTHVNGDLFTEDPGVGNDEHSELLDPPPRQRRPFNRQGMRGNQNHHNQHYVCNDDHFAKVKFSIPPFNSSYDAEAYLDWEMTIEQKFSLHLVPE
jgi:hypothetical protein